MLQLFAFMGKKKITKSKKKLIPYKLQCSLYLNEKALSAQQKEKEGMFWLKSTGLIRLFCILACFQRKQSCREGTITEGETE